MLNPLFSAVSSNKKGKTTVLITESHPHTLGFRISLKKFYYRKLFPFSLLKNGANSFPFWEFFSAGHIFLRFLIFYEIWICEIDFIYWKHFKYFAWNKRFFISNSNFRDCFFFCISYNHRIYIFFIDFSRLKYKIITFLNVRIKIFKRFLTYSIQN